MSQLRLPAGGLIGRDREAGFLERFFRQAAVSGGALLLSGEPGVGKTALLDALGDRASGSGTMVLRVAGAEFEGDVSFAALNQALFPLFGDFDELDAAHRDALGVALGLGAGPAPDRLLVFNATLALLRHVAARVPLLLIVDDLPWIDRASAGVLSFAARRLVGSRVGLLAASRTGARSYFDRAGLPEYELAPSAIWAVLADGSRVRRRAAPPTRGPGWTSAPRRTSARRAAPTREGGPPRRTPPSHRRGSRRD